MLKSRLAEHTEVAETTKKEMDDIFDMITDTDSDED